MKCRADHVCCRSSRTGWLSSWKRIGGQAVAHRDHRCAGAVGEQRAPRMLGVQITHDEPTTVQPQDGSLRRVRPIDPYRHIRVPRHRAVFDLQVRRVGRGYRGGQFGEVLPGGDRVGQVGRGEERDECFEFGIDDHADDGRVRQAYSASGDGSRRLREYAYEDRGRLRRSSYRWKLERAPGHTDDAAGGLSVTHESATATG